MAARMHSNVLQGQEVTRTHLQLARNEPKGTKVVYSSPFIAKQSLHPQALRGRADIVQRPNITSIEKRGKSKSMPLTSSPQILVTSKRDKCKTQQNNGV